MKYCNKWMNNVNIPIKNRLFVFLKKESFWEKGMFSLFLYLLVVILLPLRNAVMMEKWWNLFGALKKDTEKSETQIGICWSKGFQAKSCKNR